MNEPAIAKWTFMLAPGATIVQRIYKERERDLLERGWIVLLRETELEPFNPPRVVDGEADPA